MIHKVWAACLLMAQFSAFSTTTSTPAPSTPFYPEIYWPLSNPPACAAIENLIDLSFRDFRNYLKWPYKVPNRTQNKNFIDNAKLYALELLKRMPFSNQSVTIEGKTETVLERSKRYLQFANINFVASSFADGHSTNFKNFENKLDCITCLQQSETCLLSTLFHEFLGHLSIMQLEFINGCHSTFQEDGSQLMEIYALMLQQKFKVRDVANMLAYRLNWDYRSWATPKIISQEWNMTHYAGGVVVALKNLAAEISAIKDSGEIFDIHNLSQQGQMLSRAMERCFQEGYDMDEVAQWAHHIPEYLGVIFGEDWETSLIDLHNDPNAVDVFDIAQYLRDCGITPVQNSLKDLLKDILCSAFSVYNMGTQGKILMLTLLGRNILFHQKPFLSTKFLIPWIFQTALFEFFKFIEGESNKMKIKLEMQIAFLEILIYPKKACMNCIRHIKKWGALTAGLWGVQYVSTHYLLPDCKKRLKQVKDYSIKVWNKITGKASDQSLTPHEQTEELAVDNHQEAIDQENQEQSESTTLQQAVESSTNNSVNPIWIHLYNFACPAALLCWFYKKEMIPEIRKSVLGVMWASIVAMAELTGHFGKSA